MFVIWIIVAILAFGILIAVHELGHFAAARIFDVKVKEFALGMGPKVLKRQKGETLYSLRLLPIGGFCAMEGEDGYESDPRPKRKNGALETVIEDDAQTRVPAIGTRSLTAKPWWQQCVVLVAGASANILIGYLICVAVRAADGGEYGFFGVFREAWSDILYFVRVIWQSLVMLVTGKVGLGDLSGPVGIVSMVGQVAAASAGGASAARNVAHFFAFIAVNLGVMNLLPIPALDGGRVLFTIITAAIEKLTRHKVSRKVEGYINAGAFVLLIGLMIFTLFNDIIRIVLARISIN
ncbi:MAG: site-2 protease family protein [Oscillospiraceae bacterium]|jgi:regulator of sigma E protease|nr:site-2 protease family protein [Oscillospiraceae bacterium]